MIGHIIVTIIQIWLCQIPVWRVEESTVCLIWNGVIQGRLREKVAFEF